MSELRTSFNQRGQKEIVISLDTQSGLDPAWLVGFLQESVANGKHFLPGQTIQIGWMLVLLKATESGVLELWEPQFDSIPIKWIRGIDNTLRHLILQKSITELLKVDPMFPSLRDSGSASKSFLTVPSPNDFRLFREPSKGNDSGWRLDAAPFKSQHTEYRSLFELSFYQMAIVPFLALPTGAVINKSGTNLVVEVAGLSLDSKQSGLLQKLANSKTLV
jgi:hypothetical protein